MTRRIRDEEFVLRRSLSEDKCELGIKYDVSF